MVGEERLAPGAGPAAEPARDEDHVRALEGGPELLFRLPRGLLAHLGQGARPEAPRRAAAPEGLVRRAERGGGPGRSSPPPRAPPPPPGGRAPAPRPRVVRRPRRILCGARIVRRCCASVFAANSSAPTMPASTRRSIVFVPPPPTPTILMFVRRLARILSSSASSAAKPPMPEVGASGTLGSSPARVMTSLTMDSIGMDGPPGMPGNRREIGGWTQFGSAYKGFYGTLFGPKEREPPGHFH